MRADPKDRKNPYFCPVAWSKIIMGLPRTLILTAEFDPLRDEGEEYAQPFAGSRK